MTEQELKDYASKRVTLIEDDPSTWSEQRKACAGMSPGKNVNQDGKANDFVPWAEGSGYRTDIRGLAADPSSETWINSMGGDQGIRLRGPIPAHISEGWGEVRYGMPMHICDGWSPRMKVRQDLYNIPGCAMDESYPTQSDPGPFPVQIPPAVQGTQWRGGMNYNVVGDKHCYMIDKDNAFLHEFYNTYWWGGEFWAGMCATFDLLGGDHQRPWGWSSSSVSGAPQFAGVGWTEQCRKGRIPHALAFSAFQGWGRAACCGVASHHQWQGNDPNKPPFGAKLRLRADFDVSPYLPQAQVILNALKEFGAVYVDGGMPVDLYYVQGDDWIWDAACQIFGTPILGNFEFVETGPIYSFMPAGPYPPEVEPPDIKLCELYPAEAKPGEPVIVYWDVSGESMRWLYPQVGALRTNYRIFYPSQPETYTLRAQNAGGWTEAVAVASVDPCASKRDRYEAQDRKTYKASRNYGRPQNFRERVLDRIEEDDRELMEKVEDSIGDKSGWWT